jgi:nucleotide-binding universal stress UspA family protein
MFKHLLVPLDGSHLSETAIPISIFLAEKLKAGITLLHIIEPDAPDTVHGEHHLKTYDEAVLYLNEIAKKKYPRGFKVKIHVHSNSETDVIKAIAEHHKELGSDLLVMTTHGWGGFKNLLWGNNAQQIINLGIMPVLFVPTLDSKTDVKSKIKRLLLPVDTTEEHKEGTDVAVSIAVSCSAEMFLVNVIPTMNTLSARDTSVGMLLPMATKEVLKLQQQEAEEYIAEKKKEISRKGIKVHTEISQGFPADGINELVDSNAIDLIVLGTHGKAGMNAFWSGSVAAKIVGKTKVAILFVPVQK